MEKPRFIIRNKEEGWTYLGDWEPRMDLLLQTVRQRGKNILRFDFYLNGYYYDFGKPLIGSVIFDDWREGLIRCNVSTNFPAFYPPPEV
jgi:hypothetical protein